MSELEVQMPGEERKQAARELIHGKEYIKCKQKIYDKLETFERDVLERTQIEIQKEMIGISRYLKYQRVFQVVENLLVILIAVVIYRNVTVVMKNYSRAICEGKHIELKGPDRRCIY